MGITQWHIHAGPLVAICGANWMLCGRCHYCGAATCFQVVGQSFGRISSSSRSEVMPQGYLMCLCVLVRMC